MNEHIQLCSKSRVKVRLDDWLKVLQGVLPIWPAVAVELETRTTPEKLQFHAKKLTCRGFEHAGP